MVTVATYETVASPGGRTGTAMTGLPTGAPSVPISWTSGWIEVSFRRPAGPDRARITGLGTPAQIEVESTSICRPPPAGALAVVAGAWVGTVVAGALPISRSVATISSAVVPNGKSARS